MRNEQLRLLRVYAADRDHSGVGRRARLYRPTAYVVHMSIDWAYYRYTSGICIRMGLLSILAVATYCT